MRQFDSIMDDRMTPRWARDIYSLLPIKSQFIFSGNIRDDYLISFKEGEYAPIDLLGLLWLVLQDLGFKKLEVFDPIDGLRIFPGDGKTAPTAMTEEELATRISKKLEAKERTALVIDFASRLNCAGRLFVTCDKLSTSLKPYMLQENNETYQFFNPIIWLFDNDRDIPPWYCAGSHRVHRLDIPRPDLEQRTRLAALKLKNFSDYEASNSEQKEAHSEIFADMSDGFTLSEMTDVANLSRIKKDVLLSDIDDAVRSYKTGNPKLDNPWKSDSLRERIRNAEETINKRVIGQQVAVRHAIDILKRSVLGLNGAHASSSSNRPRGVLFLAGPTGVGKTELAKTLAKVLFGDENAMIRFDMSEFSQAHSDARLLGAPPGYVGYEGGGELINSIRQKPFSLVLFDEIEKANGKILDKFLQILEDGRITSGQGETVYFSECIIVFTSNMGIMKEERDAFGNVIKAVPVVTWKDDYGKVEKEVRTGIESHFMSILKRPELLNRLGNNILVFDFIRPSVADKIIDIMLSNIAARIKEEYNANLKLGEAAEVFLRERCKQDLSNGGRGIGNCLETMLVNPLSRELFNLGSIRDKSVTVSAIKVQRHEGSDADTFVVDVQNS